MARQLGILINLDKCVGCNSCIIACKQETTFVYGDELGKLPEKPAFRKKVLTIGPIGIFPKLKMHYLPIQCNHCQDPHCLMVCPPMAIEKRSDGIVVIERDKCIMCGDCVKACPYDVFYFDREEKIIDKCTMCVHRVDKGLAPACVLACITKAMEFGDLADPQSEVAKKLREDYKDSFVLRPEMNTKPSIYYKLSSKKRS